MHANLSRHYNNFYMFYILNVIFKRLISLSIFSLPAKWISKWRGHEILKIVVGHLFADKENN